MGTKFPFIRYDYKIIGVNMICRKSIIFLLVVGALMAAGCSQTPKTSPEDFMLYYYWNTGALAPEYYYHYEIEIDPDGNGKLTLQRGYEDIEREKETFAFTVASQDWSNFYTWLNESNILRNDWKESEEILLGGSTTEVKLQVNGEKYIIPSVSVLSQNERKIYYALEEQIKLLVPTDIWEQIE
jgi:hypothetical protein